MSLAKPTLLGRQAWPSLYESLTHVTRRILLGPTPARHFSAGPSVANAYTSFGRRPFPRFTWRTFRRSQRAFAPNARRSITSGGLLLVSVSPTSSTSSNVVASCTAAADTAVAIAGGATQKASITTLARQAWRRGCCSERCRTLHNCRRTKSTHAGSSAVKPKPPQPKQETEESVVAAKPSVKGNGDGTPQEKPETSHFHLPAIPGLSHLPRRPTKDEFLAAANGFWGRLKVRFKWFSIRSMRPWNTDEWGAFVSFFLFGHLVWILLGTTTFVSLIIFSINTVFAQETLAKWIGDYLTQSAGVSVVFESAIVPRWKDGVISFRNVFVSRRPGQMSSSVSKGSSSSAAAVAAAGRDTDKDKDSKTEQDDGNYTQFDITLNTVNVTLSFVKWWNGKGLLKDVEVKGVRGVVDRTSVEWSSANLDPLSYRHEHQPGDFEIDSFKLEDLLVTVHQPDGFRPFSVSIYSCELPQLRKRYLFYDMLSATHMSGSFDGSLFTIHPRQVHGIAAGREHIGEDFGGPDAWKKFSRLRIDGLKIDHLNRGDQGPFGWIYEGNVDIVADVMLPNDDEATMSKVMSEFYDRLEDAVTSNRYLYAFDHYTREQGFTAVSNAVISETANIADESDPQSTPSEPGAISDATLSSSAPVDDPPSYLVMDLRIHLNDVKATVPVFNSDLSYINQALVRPIVAYINAKRTYIPISCCIVKRAADFDGAWTFWDSGLMSDMSAEVYAAFARDIEDQQSRVRRLKKVGFWTLSLAVHALFVGMAGNVV
jgi:mitochondrial distribution and morphology protein 31